MRQENPRVTVLMPVYNGGKYLREAFESILNQTFTDFEFLVINDGSTDASAEIIESYADTRIRFVQNDANLGLIATLNKGLDLARGEYIARMDQDDISLPERLAKQVAFMESHPEVGVCGTWLMVSSEKKNYIQKYSIYSEEIKCSMLYYCGVAHPSVIIRKNIILQNHLYYDENYANAEDYELWVRFFNHAQFANLPEALLRYHICSTQMSSVYEKEQKRTASRVREKQLRSLGIEPDEDELNIHESLANYNFQRTEQYIEKVSAWLLKVKEANNHTRQYAEPLFSSQLKQYWFHVCYYASGFGNCNWKLFAGSQLYDNAIIGWSQKLKFIIKSTFVGKLNKYVRCKHDRYCGHKY